MPPVVIISPSSNTNGLRWVSLFEILKTKRLGTYFLKAARYAPNETHAASNTEVLPEPFFPANTFILGFNLKVSSENFL